MVNTLTASRNFNGNWWQQNMAKMVHPHGYHHRQILHKYTIGV
ncbi:hypothetical protein ACM26V_06825 [Salipaludibacillus sp. HK11]